MLFNDLNVMGNTCKDNTSQILPKVSAAFNEFIESYTMRSQWTPYIVLYGAFMDYCRIERISVPLEISHSTLQTLMGAHKMHISGTRGYPIIANIFLHTYPTPKPSRDTPEMIEI